MWRYLKCTKGPLDGEIFTLRERLFVGRGADTDIQLVDPRVSRQHACIYLDDESRVVITDLSSRNGTIVGHQAIKHHFLQPDEQIIIGNTSFIYVEDESSDASEETSRVDIKLASGPAEMHTVMEKSLIRKLKLELGDDSQVISGISGELPVADKAKPTDAEALRRQALSKLTEEERRALGL